MITYWNIDNLFNELPKELFDLSGWYISGSAATCATYNDIDIYFESKEAFDAVYALFASFPGYNCYDMKNLIEVTPKSQPLDTFFDGSTPREISRQLTSKYIIQLICKFFGPPEEVLSKFDINICRNAILPDKTYYQHPTSLDLMYIDNITSSSANRLHKYIMRGFPIDRDKYIEFVNYLCSNPNQKFDSFYENSMASSYDLLRTLLSISPLLKITIPIMLRYNGMLDIIKDNKSVEKIIPNNLLPLEIFSNNPYIMKYCHSSFASQHPEIFI